MLLEETKKDFRTEFLLKFTEEMIKNMPSYRESLLKTEVKEFIKKEEKEKGQKEEEREHRRDIQKREIGDVIHRRLAEEDRKISEMEKFGLAPELKKVSESALKIKTPAQIKKIKPILKIQELPLPETVSHLKPVPTGETIDIGNLNAFVRDPLVKIIECDGPGENIVVGGVMGRKPTAIKLSQEEIEEILGKFSAASRIPVHEGLFKAAIGNLVISAVVSDIAGIKFVIRKIVQRF